MPPQPAADNAHVRDALSLLDRRDTLEHDSHGSCRSLRGPYELVLLRLHFPDSLLAAQPVRGRILERTDTKMF